MSSPLLGREIQEKFDRMKALLQRSVALVDRCNDRSSRATLEGRLKALDAAALFVIVGEVKSGKSSFVNALLGQDVCEVAPDPCTAGIQELVFGPVRETVTLGDHWERVFLPAAVLNDISIVDTPGTNSIIANHQTITENYIPQSDLVVFVFPAKNPHTNTAWELLSFVRQEWHRKTVFVLQQADLASQKELAINQERVKQYARERNVQNPVVFTVSAKREMEGSSDSGFSEFREYLRKTVQDGDIWRLKMDGARETVRKVMAGLLAGLSDTRAALVADRDFLLSLKQMIDARREKAASFGRLAVDSLAITYDRLVAGLQEEFKRGLEVGTILRRAIPFVRDKDVKTWMVDLQQEFVGRAKPQVQAEVDRVSVDVLGEIKSLFDDLSKEIELHRVRIPEGRRSINYERLDVFEELNRNIHQLRIADITSVPLPAGHENLGSLTLAGGGIAAIGTVIAISTNILMVDLTGGVLAVVGVALVLATLIWKRKTIVRDFDDKIEASRKEFRERLASEIARLFDRLFLELEYRVSEPLSVIEKKLVELAPLVQECEELKELTTST